METSEPLTAAKPVVAGRRHRQPGWIRAAPLAAWLSLAAAAGYVLAAAGAAWIVSGGPAATQTRSAPPVLQSADEIEKFCGKVNIGSGKVLQCLQQHRDQVPPKCFQDFAVAAASLSKRVAAQDDAFEICKHDIRQYCPGVKPGDARILDCLNASTKVVGAACKQVLLDAGWQ